MKKRLRAGAALIATALLLPAAAPAGDAAFEWGFRERLRETSIRNGFDLENDVVDDLHFLRVRTQLWGRWRPAAGWELYAMLNNEHRHWFKPDRDFEFGEDLHELIFENLYVRASEIGGRPIDVTLGRQDIMLGEGFLFLDGGTLDGSRTAYMNALRIGVGDASARRLELFVISNPETDEYLPVVNDRDQGLTEWGESGAALYFTDRSSGPVDYDLYYAFKREKDDDGIFPETTLHTVGGRASAGGGGRLRFAAEAAFQSGERGDADRSGLGGYVHGTYAPPSRLSPAMTAGLIYLSGDDPRSGDYEGWDPLYSRWPKWSELYIYTLVGENGVAYWNNLLAPYLQLSLRPEKRIELIGEAYLMYAPEQAPVIIAPGDELPVDWANAGTEERGLLTRVWLKWRATRYLTGHLLWERFDPGNFYDTDADTAHFLRWEFMFTY
ncbi:MAG: alginate export family protein [Candidatus Krumholzibacteriota bacterium]|nr:alginate export family protein [Candidatus Krumholzibacteriota bacterium]